ncbi:MAG: hypothetical protein Q9191_002428 [Dirinaria sp. TL-2023a]
MSCWHNHDTSSNPKTLPSKFLYHAQNTTSFDNRESFQLKSTTYNAGNAVLCTDRQTYSIRQVHNSNSIFILQPSQSVVGTAEPGEGVSAIARCPTTLELVPSASVGVEYLKRVLPRYTGPASFLGEKDNIASDVGTGAYRGREALLDDAPLSREEFHSAWTELCAFESDGNAMLPTARALHALWKSIISAATATGIKIDESLYISSIAEVVEEDGFPQSLLHAVISRLSVEQIVPVEGWANITAAKSVPWLGTVILDSNAISSEGILESMFLQEWQNLLPESWREHVSLTLLKGEYLEPAKGKIMSREVTVKAGRSSSEALAPSGKRPGKWHEKFKNDRR